MSWKATGHGPSSDRREPARDAGSNDLELATRVLSDEPMWQDRAGARTLIFGAGGAATSGLLVRGEVYRCGRAVDPWADLIAQPTDLTALPDVCFDFLIADRTLLAGDGADLDAMLREIWRVLVPDGLFVAVAPGGPTDRLNDHFRVRAIGHDNGVSGEVLVCRKDAPALDEQPAPPAELTGYAFHLSRKSGRRIVFCLDGPLQAGDRLPVQSASGGIVAHVTVGDYRGGRANPPPEPWREGFRLPPRASYELDPSLASGLYALDGTIPFVHRRDGPASVAVLLPSHTATGFNPAGGRRFYETDGNPPADVLSFQRPLAPHLPQTRAWPFIQWFASHNPHADDTTYLIDSDLEEPDALDGVGVLIVVGRSEYWTRTARERFDAFVDRGGRALLLCSEIMYWQVRVDLERQLLYRYKGADPHPDPLLRTTLWHDPSLEYPIYPRTGCELRHGGFDALGDGVGWGGMRVVCPDSPLLAGSGLAAGDVVRLPDASMWDGAPVENGPDGVPRVDFGDSPPWRHEVIGHNLVRPIDRKAPEGQVATSLWIALRRTPTSGTVVHCGTFGWAGARGVGGHGPDSDRIQAIVLHMLSVLLDDNWPFSGPSKAA